MKGRSKTCYVLAAAGKDESIQLLRQILRGVSGAGQLRIQQAATLEQIRRGVSGAGAQSPADLLDRIGYLEDIFRGKESDPDCSFILSTIHASKGLEYDTVYLMDVADGLFPEEVPASMKYMQPEERRAFEEERRLFYVGMTRAKKRLFVFTTGAKSVLADELFGREKVRKR